MSFAADSADASPLDDADGEPHAANEIAARLATATAVMRVAIWRIVVFMLFLSMTVAYEPSDILWYEPPYLVALVQPTTHYTP